MTKLPSKWADHEEHIWQCDCGGDCYLRLVWDGLDDDWRFLWISSGHYQGRLTSRLKTAFTLVFRPHSYVPHSEIVLTPERCAELAAVASSLAAPAGAVRDTEEPA